MDFLFVVVSLTWMKAKNLCDSGSGITNASPSRQVMVVAGAKTHFVIVSDMFDGSRKEIHCFILRSEINLCMHFNNFYHQLKYLTVLMP